MKKIILVLIIVTINLAILNSQQWESVLELSFGNKQQQVGIDEGPLGFGSITCIVFDKNNYMYISDNINNRILVFNEKLKFSKEIKNNNRYLASTGRILIDDDLNIWGFSSGYGFKIDNNGNVLVEKKRQLLPFHSETWRDIGLYNNKIIGSLKYEKKLVLLDENGKEFDVEKVEKHRDNLLAEQRHNNLSRSNTDIDISNIKDNVKKKMVSFIDENGKLFSVNKKEYTEYAKILRTEARDKKLTDSRSNSEIKFTDEPFVFYRDNNGNVKFQPGWNLFGTDNLASTYWYHFSGKIKIFDKYGQLLKEISLVELYKKSNVDTLRTLTIDQKGNIYYAWMHSDVGFRLYQYTRDW